MYVVDSATVSIHIVCLCLVLPMFRLVGFIFATAKAPQQSSLHPTDGRDGGRLGGPSLGGSLCNHFELWRQDSWSNASFYGWRESIWATGIFSLMVGLPPARRAVIYWSEWSWSCSPPISPAPPLQPSTWLTLIILTTPSSHSLTNAAQKGFQEIHRRRGRPSAS